MKFTYSVAGRSDRGLVRAGNEDSLKIDRENDLFIVCDGMGGHQAGEVASREACDVIGYCFTDLAEKITAHPELNPPAEMPQRGALLISAIRIANRSIYIHSRANSALSGMGTTLVAMVLEENLAGIAHVGDSRVYRYAGDRLIRMTSDHSWVSELQASGQVSPEEAARMAGRNVITRALGVNERVDVDFRSEPLKAGDIFILCTDGLCGYAEDEEIRSVLNSCQGDLNAMVENLIKLANEHGGQDNVTVLTIRIDSVEKPPEDVKSFGPVTVSKEGEEALAFENSIVNTIIDIREKAAEEDITITADSKTSHLPLMLIFLAFIVIAVLFIIFYSGD